MPRSTAPLFCFFIDSLMGILSRLNIGLVPCWCLIVIREKKLSEKDADTSSSSALSWFETDSLWFASLSTRSWRILLPLNIDLVLCWCLIVLREKRRARRTRRLLLPRLYHVGFGRFDSVEREKRKSEKDAETSSSSALSWFETDSLWFASLSTRSWRILLHLNMDLVLCCWVWEVGHRE
ncbi:uncharacterized protein LOC110008289 [Amborella trichopoda]|uniref:uncharacterized protein LOC110008289 n=1 Tax=Amborella trichopoda TaxID=13333 RepID=UPI0009BFC0A9|nr:uncharacterized protein LOC110008289 [Amborella trichopoda]|eukprot:XP_020530567.1 uncharacterized protein LOC110008289 [Amborella trichopoda]